LCLIYYIVSFIIDDDHHDNDVSLHILTVVYREVNSVIVKNKK